MSEELESDIGLTNLARPSTSPPTRPAVHIRSLSNGLKSPSTPELSPKSPPRLSRRNTNPRKMSVPAHDADLALETMESDMVVNMRRWICGMAVVDFDLDIGPKIICVYPALDLSPAEEENIAFSSFPDSPQFEQGSQAHSFRIRVRNSTEDKLLPRSEQRPHTEDGFLYGFSHFTQRRDTTSKRGYQQRSIVILTHFAYPTLFYTLLTKLGPAFIAHGGPMLEAACHNIAHWPEPNVGTTLELGFLGTVFLVDLPIDINTQQAPPSASVVAKIKSYDPRYHILASLAPPDPPALSLFEACIPHLWSIWECLVLCEPILIYAPSPAMTSQAVWWLRDVLRPIPVAGDFRPFFTIHDTDHTALVNPRPPSAGLVLGVTNPYFARACRHWPHILSLGKPSVTKSVQHGNPAPPPGWKTQTHKRYISRDRALLQALQDACSGSERAMHDASALLRQHFSQRTAALLVPLQRYLQSLIPAPLQLGPSLEETFPQSLATPAQTPRLAPFSERAFLETLKPLALPFKSSSKAREFYVRWIRTPSFGVWLARQEEAVDRVLGAGAFQQ
ncbi:DUF1630-domain-containing protein [Wolfiporia cocos MD-104 SS10]|uniref:DUF1630-domain-containing protein n=1 Tax=Wolfiporia cocos (strain MD-104) TaxID=742152 RepID=A0A2H3JTR4_WOLCO|nr:DUF1630-domain-containing protein [Wolfiporia cocos MD-104 SS10]